MVQYVFGNDLHDLKFGYVNNDDPFGLTRNLTFDTGELTEAKCFETKFSQLFLSKISSDSLTLVSEGFALVYCV